MTGTTRFGGRGRSGDLGSRWMRSGARFTRMSRMEVADMLRGIDVTVKLPRIFRDVVTFPTDLVVEGSAAIARIEDFLNFVPGAGCGNMDRGRRKLFPIWDSRPVMSILTRSNP